MAHPGGFEPPTARFVAEYSIQLSYGCTINMAAREGFEPSMQLLTAYSLSRGAPSASRPPHHQIATRQHSAIYLLRGAHITFPDLEVKQFFQSFYVLWLVCTFHNQDE